MILKQGIFKRFIKYERSLIQVATMNNSYSESITVWMRRANSQESVQFKPRIKKSTPEKKRGKNDTKIGIKKAPSQESICETKLENERNNSFEAVHSNAIFPVVCLIFFNLIDVFLLSKQFARTIVQHIKSDGTSNRTEKKMTIVRIRRRKRRRRRR